MRKIDPDEEIFPIGVVSNLTGLPQRYLRILEERGVLKPRRSPKNRRLYSENDIQILHRIAYLGGLRKINISGIKEIFSILEILSETEKNKVLSWFDSESAKYSEALKTNPQMIPDALTEQKTGLVAEFDSELSSEPQSI